MIALEILWVGGTSILLVFFLYLFAIAVSSYLQPPRPPGRAPGPVGTLRFVIVIPAHDEERTIRPTIESCLAIDYDRSWFRVVVVADNCTDATDQVARSHGAEVIERIDPVRRGKGYALDFFFRTFPATAPEPAYDAVVVIDADTVVAPNILSAFADSLAAGHDWIQCYNTVRNSDASWRTRILTFALSLVNGVWLLGQQRLKMSVGLQGNGMCFSRDGLRRHPWDAFGLVEDKQFSWSLRLAGERAWFAPEASVLSEMVTQDSRAARSQCQRWHFGRTALHAEFLGPLLRSRSLGPLNKLLYLVDLCFPPMLKLMLCFLASASIQGIALVDPRFGRVSNALIPVHAFGAFVIVIYAIAPIFAMKLPARYLVSSLLASPYYLIWKLVATRGRPPAGWVRTDREAVQRPDFAEDGLCPVIRTDVNEFRPR